MAACTERAGPGVHEVAGGDPAKGKAVVESIGCGACHRIPGIPGAIGIVGPSLAGFGSRPLIAGVAPNNADTRAAFVRNAPAFAPKSAMPAFPIDEDDARHVAEFLRLL